MNKRILIIGGVVLALLVQIGLAWFFWSTSEPAPETADAEAGAAGTRSGKGV